jgi:phosphohistidine phosphatase SixA
MKLLALIAVAATAAAPAPPADLFAGLRQGGYVLVMRHARSPGAPPAPAAADPGNPRAERQLDERGRAEAEAMGRGVKARRIPIGEVFSSPTYRALQTARLAGFAPKPQAELGDGGSSMAAAASGPAGDAWLKAKAAEAPRRGTDTLLVTHGPNIARAFGAKDVADGETLVFKPDGRGGSNLVGRVKIEQWPMP